MCTRCHGRCQRSRPATRPRRDWRHWAWLEEERNVLVARKQGAWVHARAWKSASDMTVQVARSLYEGTILRVMRVTMPSMPRLGKTQSSNLSSYRVPYRWVRLIGYRMGGGLMYTKEVTSPISLIEPSARTMRQPRIIDAVDAWWADPPCVPVMRAPAIVWWSIWPKWDGEGHRCIWQRRRRAERAGAGARRAQCPSWRGRSLFLRER